MIEINLLPGGLKAREKKPGPGMDKRQVLYIIIPLILALLIVTHFYLAIVAINKNTQLQALRNKWQSLGTQRKGLEGFKQKYDMSSANTLDYTDKGRINWSEKLNILSLKLPYGLWFSEISAASGRFLLEGAAISLQKDEMGLIKAFIDNLKNDTAFFSDFNALELSSWEKKTLGSYDVVDFILTGTLKPK